MLLQTLSVRSQLTSGRVPIYRRLESSNVWRRDIKEAAAVGCVQSVVCCGHSPKSQISHMAFQPNGNFLVGLWLYFDAGVFIEMHMRRCFMAVHQVAQSICYECVLITLCICGVNVAAT